MLNLERNKEYINRGTSHKRRLFFLAIDIFRGRIENRRRQRKKERIKMDAIGTIIQQQKAFFNSNATKSYNFRIAQLHQLKESIIQYEGELYEAFEQDLHKSKFEVYATEIGYVLTSIGESIKHLKKWMAPKKVRNPIYLLGSKSYTLSEPYGVMTIIGPFNYPFQLVIEPLIGAIASGNTAVIKTSELTPHVSRVIKNMLASTFDSSYIAVIEGGVEETTELLTQPVDYIFFTGSTRVGKIVMEAAAKQLIPVTLELGGKSPAIITASANLQKAARKIVWGKYLNNGQTCVAPDYVLVEDSVESLFLDYLKKEITAFYGDNPVENADYARLVTKEQTERLASMLRDTRGEVVIGGQYDVSQKYISPTVIHKISTVDKVMEEEIFGPILPVLTYKASRFDQEVVDVIKKGDKPLALYLFTEDREIKDQVLSEISFGGGTINDTIYHLVNSRLPFGGVGASGIGSYHGKTSYQQFTHNKAVVEKNTWLDMSLLYPPYNKLKLGIIKQVMK